MSEAAQRDETVVLGIDNTLMGYEGVGIVVARGLEQQWRAHGIRLVDGGTGGFHLHEQPGRARGTAGNPHDFRTSGVCTARDPEALLPRLWQQNSLDRRMQD